MQAHVIRGLQAPNALFGETVRTLVGTRNHPKTPATALAALAKAQPEHPMTTSKCLATWKAWGAEGCKSVGSSLCS